jgi:alpha-galactosidase
MTASVGGEERGARRLGLYAHPAWVDLDLQPGESVVLPRAVLGFFSGDEMAGSNALRRHVVRHVMRPVAGTSAAPAPPLPPVYYNHWYGFWNDWTLEDLRAEAEAYADLGAEYFVMDAGWFAGRFRAGIGNWEQADERFPHGMEELAEHVESVGMKFGSWLEIEFALRESDWGQRHRDWFWAADGRQNPMYNQRRFGDLLLRLDDPAVRGPVADFLNSWVERYHIRWLRWDFNNAPYSFWEANEAETRGGWLHLGYGEGLLALLDEFMARCPQVHIEACAGGGHRLDLGTLRRAHSAWMNDNSHSYDAIRRFQMGLNRVLPGNYPSSCFLYATHAGQRPETVGALQAHGYPPAVLRSRMAGSLGFSERSTLWRPEMRAYLRREIARYKEIRPLLQQDFYPLYTPAGLREYDGWQFHDPGRGEGTVMIFRCRSTATETQPLPRGLEPGRLYRMTDVDSGEQWEHRGGEPLTLRVPETEGTRWLRYALSGGRTC